MPSKMYLIDAMQALDIVISRPKLVYLICVLSRAIGLREGCI